MSIIKIALNRLKEINDADLEAQTLIAILYEMVDDADYVVEEHSIKVPIYDGVDANKVIKKARKQLDDMKTAAIASTKKKPRVSKSTIDDPTGVAIRFWEQNFADPKGMSRADGVKHLEDMGIATGTAKTKYAQVKKALGK